MRLDEFAETMFLLGRIDAKLDRVRAEIAAIIQTTERMLAHDAAARSTLATTDLETAQ